MEGTRLFRLFLVSPMLIEMVLYSIQCIRYLKKTSNR
jgi:hypothetical protein